MKKNELQIFSSDIIKYCSDQKKRYDLWVYDGNQVIQVYEKQTPNTDHIWFQFYTFSYLYWKMMENTCVQDIKGNFYYNFNKIRQFMINYLLCGTNIPGIVLKRKNDGTLTEQSMDSVMKIHPRILRSLFNLINIFPEKMTHKQEKQLQKQCAILFGQGDSVTNPNKWIVIYCNLMSFWDKFGLNYFDILKLPSETFFMLKKIMGLESDFKNKDIQKTVTSNKGKGVRF